MTDRTDGRPPPGESVSRNVRTDPALTVSEPESTRIVLGTPAGVIRTRIVPGATVTYGDAAPNASVGTTGVADPRSAVDDVT
jgi:hypothetical protein